MTLEIQLQHPWLIAVWPGMGQVAISAGYYLMAKLEMSLLNEFAPRELFDVDHVEVENGLLRTAALPRSRLFVWRDPDGKRDLVVFFGEAQPPQGKYSFCQRIVEMAKQLGVERIFTFAAMATAMHPKHDSRVFAVATNETELDELKRQKFEILQDGHIGGLNGLLLGAAAEAGLHGACLMGEMPHVFAQFPFPKASLAVLQGFQRLSGLQIDLTELSQQSQAVDEQLGELLEQVQKKMATEEEPEEATSLDEEETDTLRAEDQRRIESLFDQSKKDRSKAYELKRELDRLNVFREYEERFLDLFKKPS